MRQRSARMLLPLLVTVLSTLVAIWNPLPLQVLRLGVFDQFQRWQPRAYQNAPVRIIDVDDESLKRLGQWPWPRTRMAELVAKLAAAQPAAIALDVLFAEPDRTSPKAMLALWPLTAQTRQQLAALPDHDAVFAGAIGQSRVVLGCAVERAEQPGALPLVKARFVVSGEPAQAYLNAFSGTLNPLPVLASAASGIGTIAFTPDADGIVRKVPMVVRVGDVLVPSLSAEALRVAAGSSNFVLHMVKTPGVGLAGIGIGSLQIPTNSQGEVWLHYAPPVASRSIPAWKILANEVNAKELAGHILLIGSSAQGLMDLRFTPLGSAVPGVEIHAQLLEQLLTGGALQSPSWTTAIQILVALAGGLLIGLIAVSRGALLAISALTVLLCVLWSMAWLAFARQGVLVDAVAPTITILLSYVFASMVHHRISEQRQRWVKQVFSRYVSPNLVTYLIKHPHAVELGGKRQQCSFVFTDLIDFTNWLEGRDPASAVSILNAYLDGMIAIAFAHQATLNRIVGDALVLTFSAPVVQPDHPRRALTCAWALHKFSTQYVARLADQGVHFGLTRIGVHSGEVIVGNFGGSHIFDYRALGDPINTAARLESANKHFGTLVCVSELILAACPEWPARPIGQVIFKGKTQAIAVFEPLEPDQAGDAAYGAAFSLLQQQSPQALAAFAELARARPADSLVAMHLARLQAGQVGDVMALTSK